MTDARAMPWSEALKLLEREIQTLKEPSWSPHERAHLQWIEALELAVALGDRCAQAEQRIALLEDALRLLLRFHSSTEHPRWGEWAGRLFDDPDEDEVSLRETEAASVSHRHRGEAP